MSLNITLPKNWEITRINSIGAVITGKTPSTKVSEYWGDDIPFITPGDILEDHYTYNTKRFVSEKGANQSRILPKDSIAVVCIGSTIGKVALVSKKSITNQQINAIICKDGVDPHYVCYAILFRNKYLRLYAGVAAVPIIKKSLFEKFRIILPSFNEQQKISSILVNIDNLIFQTKKIIGNLQLLKKGLMQRLFTEGIGHTEFKETSLGKIPKEWEIKNFKEIGNFQYGYTTSAISNDTGIKFLRITDIKENGFFDWDDIPFAEIDSDESNKFILKKGDIVIARIGATTGKTCYIDNLKGDMIFASYLIRFKINKTVIPKFIFYYSQTKFYVKFIYIFKEGKLKKGINAQELKKFKISIPKVEEQKKIVEILSKIDLKIKNENNYKNELKIIKKGLMQDLLTGKKRVKIY